MLQLIYDLLKSIMGIDFMRPQKHNNVPRYMEMHSVRECTRLYARPRRIMRSL